ncbi:MAG: hypothetical protein EPO68_00405 [Planctomycetota bacterium]|nr:MAG: hypothetical protein EPO68_00405 [Planctomycetota bacterium]
MHIHGDGASSVFVGNAAPLDPSFWAVGITGVALGSELTVAGMTIQANASTGALTRPVVLVQDCAGSVTLHGCAFPMLFAGVAAETLSLRQASWTILSSSSIDAYSGAVGIRAASSGLWIQDSTVVPGDMQLFKVGLQAVVLEDSALYVVSSVLRGNAGANSGGPVCSLPTLPLKSAGKPGWHAIESFGASIVKIVGGPGALIQGGDAGAGLCPMYFVPGGNAIRAHDATQVLAAPIAGLLQSGFPSSGAPLPAIEVSESAIAFQGAPLYPSLDVVPTLASPGASIQLEVQGNPQSRVVYFAALELADAPIAMPGIDGALALAASFFPLGSKMLDAQGAASLSVVLPADPAFVGLAPRVQVLEFGPAQLAVSNPELIVLL